MSRYCRRCGEPNEPSLRAWADRHPAATAAIISVAVLTALGATLVIIAALAAFPVATFVFLAIVTLAISGSAAWARKERESATLRRFNWETRGYK